MKAVFRMILDFFGKFKSLLNKRGSKIFHHVSIKDTNGDGKIDTIKIDLVSNSHDCNPDEQDDIAKIGRSD